MGDHGDRQPPVLARVAVVVAVVVTAHLDCAGQVLLRDRPCTPRRAHHEAVRRQRARRGLEVHGQSTDDRTGCRDSFLTHLGFPWLLV